MLVTLRIYQNQNYQRQAQTTTDASGQYQFTGLDEDPAFQYLPVVDYQNVTYVGTPARFQDQQSPTGHDDVAIYETTADDPGLRYENATLVLGGVSQQSQHLSFLELLTLDNPSDRTFLPSAPAQGMPKNLLRFGLPSGVDDIGVQSGLDLNRLIQVDRGLASTAPVTPGSHTISFSFAVPYNQGAFHFAWPLVYPAAAVHVLEPTSGAVIQAAGLTAEPDLTLDGSTFHVLGRGAADATAVIDVAVTGLPDRSFLQSAGIALGRQGTVATIGIVGALLAALIPAAVLLRRRGRPAPVAPESSEALLDAVAALDDAWERGEIAEEPYRQQRDALKEKLSQRARLTETADAAQP